MKLLIYGSRGWIGKQLTTFLTQKHINWLAGTSRVDNIDNLREELTKVAPTHVFSLIGRTNGTFQGQFISTIDYLEKPGCLNYNVRDNLFGPLTLAILCKERNIHYSYLGTGCIFEYDNKHTPTNDPFTESDLPNFLGSSYSTVKGYTDRLMHLFDDSALNLRIRMPITNIDNPRNFISKITRYEKVCSIPNSMTVLTDFFPIWLDLMTNCKTGTFNCTNPGVITHNEILEMYREIVDKSFKWANFTIEEQAQILAAGRSNNFLSTEKIQNDYPNILPIKESVRKVLQEWRSSEY